MIKSCWYNSLIGKVDWLREIVITNWSAMIHLFIISTSSLSQRIITLRYTESCPLPAHSSFVVRMTTRQLCVNITPNVTKTSTEHRAQPNSIKYVTISNTVKYLTVALFAHLTNSIYLCLFALIWFTDVKFT